MKTERASVPCTSLHHLSPEAERLKAKLEHFVANYCEPAEIEYELHLKDRVGKDRWTSDAIPPCLERLKDKAKSLGLWNLFLPLNVRSHILHESYSKLSGEQWILPNACLSNREYGILCEIMGKSFLAPEACNCSAPDTGNMEVLLKHGTAEQQLKYLIPLLKGKVRSCFLMTEPTVASSDATNIETKLTKIVESHNGNVRYVLNGMKWWSSGAMDPRCRVALVLAKMDYSHPSCKGSNNCREGTVDDSIDEKVRRRNIYQSHTVVVFPIDTPGVHCVRPLTVFGYDDAPHGHAEVELRHVQLESSSVILGEGRGFEIAQSRLGPGRVHHCMRAVGMAKRCYDLMVARSLTRTAFGRKLAEHGSCQELIAESAIDVQTARLLTLECAAAIDEMGPISSRDRIAMIKVAVPRLTLRVADRAVQVFGGAGVSGDYPLAKILSGLRTLKIADGPDAVHLRTVAKLEVKKTLSRL